MEKLLQAIAQGVPPDLLGKRKWRREKDLYALGQDFLGDCMLRLIAAEGGPLVPRPDPHLLLECLRPRNLWGYYRTAPPDGPSVEDWILGVGEVAGFPDLPAGFPRAKWLFAKPVPEWMVERGYFYTLAFRPEVPERHRQLFLWATTEGGMVEFRHRRNRLYHKYLRGLGRGGRADSDG